MQEENQAIEVEAGVTDDRPDDTDHDEQGGSGVVDHLARLARIVESVLFAAGTPLSLKKLIDILSTAGARPTAKEVQAALVLLRSQYDPVQRGIQLHEVAGGYQFRTARENAEWVRAVFRDKPARLGRATLETLAIVAYKQPVTRAEIEAIRGVDVDGVLSTLLARRLIKIAGRKEAVGRPLLYTTSPEFLETFGLKDLNDLPSLKELGPLPDAETIHTASDETAQTQPTDDGSAAPASADASPSPDAAIEPGSLAEDPEPSGDRLTAPSGGDDPHGARAGERSDGDDPGDEGGPPKRPDHS